MQNHSKLCREREGEGDTKGEHRESDAEAKTIVEFKQMAAVYDKTQPTSTSRNSSSSDFPWVCLEQVSV